MGPTKISCCWSETPPSEYASRVGISYYAKNLGNTRGAADEDHLMHVLLVDARVPQAFFDRAHGVAEVVHVQLLEPRPGQRAAVVDTFDLSISLMTQCTLSYHNIEYKLRGT